MNQMVTPTEVARGVDAVVDGTKSIQLASRANSTGQQIDELGGAAMRHPAVKAAANKEQQMALNALKADEAAHKASAADKVIGVASIVSGLGGMVAFIGPGALRVVAWPFKKVGEWTGFKLSTKVSDAIRKPADYFTKKTVGEFGQDLGIGEIAGKGSQKVVDGVAAATEKADETFGFGKRFFASNFGKAQKHLSKAQAHAGNINWSEVHQELHEPLKRLQKQIQNAENVGHLHSTHFANAGDVLSSGSGVVDKASQALAEGGKNVIGGSVGVVEKVAPAANKNIQHTVAELESLMENIAKAKGSKAASSRDTLKAVNGLINESSHVVSKLNAAEGWRNPGKAVRGMPGGLAKGNLSHVTVNGLFIVGSLVSGFQDLKAYFNERKAHKAMRADGVSEEAISMAKKGSLKKLALKQVADVVNIGINVVQAVNHKFSMGKSLVAFGGAEVVSRLADNLTENKIEPAYEAFKRSYLAAKATGTELTADYYAAFIEEVSKDLKAQGGAKNAHVQEVAKQLADAKLTPAQVLNEATNGRLSQRLYNVIDANKAAHPAAERSISNVDRARGHRQRKDMPVVGHHTQNVVNENTLQPGVVRT